MKKFLNILQPYLEISITMYLENDDAFNTLSMVNLNDVRLSLNIDDSIGDEIIKEFITANYSNTIIGTIAYLKSKSCE